MISTHLRNGEFVEADYATDRSLLYGDGVFTTLVLKEGRLILIDNHLDRLKRDSQRLNINNVCIEQLKLQISKAIKSHTDGIIRITIARSSGQRGYLCENNQPVYWISINSWPEHIKRYQQKGINVRLCKQLLSKNPTLAGIKHCNRLEQVLARNEWHDDSYQEGLMMDFDGHLIEGTMSNLFYIKQDTLFTPELTYSGVNGIMRDVIINAAKQSNIPLMIAPVTIEQIKQADSVFVTNSVIAIWMVNRFEEITYLTTSSLKKDKTVDNIIDKINAEIHKTLSL